MEKRFEGRVTRIFRNKGYFFVEDGTGQSWFSHFSALERAGIEGVFLQEGTRLSFALEPSHRHGGKDIAVNLKLVDANAVGSVGDAMRRARSDWWEANKAPRRAT